jgi:hypothetical protein
MPAEECSRFTGATQAWPGALLRMRAASGYAVAAVGMFFSASSWIRLSSGIGGAK